MKRKKPNYVSIGLAALVVILAIALTYVYTNQAPVQAPRAAEPAIIESPTPIVVDESLEGFVAANISVDPSTVYLEANCYRLSMQTTQGQAFSIQTAIEGRLNFRPMTHDIIKDMLDYYGVTLKSVKISGVVDSVYTSELVLEGQNKTLVLDSRPTDAIALGLRYDLPIYIKEQFMRDGIKIC